MNSAPFKHASEQEALAQVAQARQLYPEAATEEGWKAVLARFGLTEKALISHLEQQIDLMRLVDAHLRPAVQIDSKSVEAYYREKFVPQLKQSGVGSVSLADVSAKIVPKEYRARTATTGPGRSGKRLARCCCHEVSCRGRDRGKLHKAGVSGQPPA